MRGFRVKVKRGIALFLAMLMVVSIIPANTLVAFAADDIGDGDTIIYEEETEAVSDNQAEYEELDEAVSVSSDSVYIESEESDSDDIFEESVSENIVDESSIDIDIVYDDMGDSTDIIEQEGTFYLRKLGNDNNYYYRSSNDPSGWCISRVDADVYSSFNMVLAKMSDISDELDTYLMDWNAELVIEIGADSSINSLDVAYYNNSFDYSRVNIDLLGHYLYINTDTEIRMNIWREGTIVIADGTTLKLYYKHNSPYGDAINYINGINFFYEGINSKLSLDCNNTILNVNGCSFLGASGILSISSQMSSGGSFFTGLANFSGNSFSSNFSKIDIDNVTVFFDSQLTASTMNIDHSSTVTFKVNYYMADRGPIDDGPVNIGTLMVYSGSVSLAGRPLYIDSIYTQRRLYINIAKEKAEFKDSKGSNGFDLREFNGELYVRDIADDSAIISVYDMKPSNTYTLTNKQGYIESSSTENTEGYMSSGKVLATVGQYEDVDKIVYSGSNSGDYEFIPVNSTKHSGAYDIKCISYEDVAYQVVKEKTSEKAERILFDNLSDAASYIKDNFDASYSYEIIIGKGEVASLSGDTLNFSSLSELYSDSFIKVTLASGAQINVTGDACICVGDFAGISSNSKINVAKNANLTIKGYSEWNIYHDLTMVFDKYSTVGGLIIGTEDSRERNVLFNEVVFSNNIQNLYVNTNCHVDSNITSVNVYFTNSEFSSDGALTATTIVADNSMLSIHGLIKASDIVLDKSNMEAFAGVTNTDSLKYVLHRDSRYEGGVLIFGGIGSFKNIIVDNECDNGAYAKLNTVVDTTNNAQGSISITGELSYLSNAGYKTDAPLFIDKYRATFNPEAGYSFDDVVYVEGDILATITSSEASFPTTSLGIESRDYVVTRTGNTVKVGSVGVIVEYYDGFYESKQRQYDSLDNAVANLSKDFGSSGSYRFILGQDYVLARDIVLPDFVESLTIMGSFGPDSDNDWRADYNNLHFIDINGKTLQVNGRLEVACGGVIKGSSASKLVANQLCINVNDTDIIHSGSSDVTASYQPVSGAVNITLNGNEAFFVNGAKKIDMSGISLGLSGSVNIASDISIGKLNVTMDPIRSTDIRVDEYADVTVKELVIGGVPSGYEYSTSTNIYIDSLASLTLEKTSVTNARLYIYGEKEDLNSSKIIINQLNSDGGNIAIRDVAIVADKIGTVQPVINSKGRSALFRIYGSTLTEADGATISINFDAGYFTLEGADCALSGKIVAKNSASIELIRSTLTNKGTIQLDSSYLSLYEGSCIQDGVGVGELVLQGANGSHVFVEGVTESTSASKAVFNKVSVSGSIPSEDDGNYMICNIGSLIVEDTYSGGNIGTIYNSGDIFIKKGINVKNIINDQNALFVIGEGGLVQTSTAKTSLGKDSDIVLQDVAPSASVSLYNIDLYGYGYDYDEAVAYSYINAAGSTELGKSLIINNTASIADFNSKIVIGKLTNDSIYSKESGFVHNDEEVYSYESISREAVIFKTNSTTGFDVEDYRIANRRGIDADSLYVYQRGNEIVTGEQNINIYILQAGYTMDSQTGGVYDYKRSEARKQIGTFASWKDTTDYISGLSNPYAIYVVEINGYVEAFDTFKLPTKAAGIVFVGGTDASTISSGYPDRIFNTSDISLTCDMVVDNMNIDTNFAFPMYRKVLKLNGYNLTINKGKVDVKNITSSGNEIITLNSGYLSCFDKTNCPNLDFVMNDGLDEMTGWNIHSNIWFRADAVVRNIEMNGAKIFVDGSLTVNNIITNSTENEIRYGYTEDDRVTQLTIKGTVYSTTDNSEETITWYQDSFNQFGSYNPVEDGDVSFDVMKNAIKIVNRRYKNELGDNPNGWTIVDSAKNASAVWFLFSEVRESGEGPYQGNDYPGKKVGDRIVVSISESSPVKLSEVKVDNSMDVIGDETVIGYYETLQEAFAVIDNRNNITSSYKIVINTANENAPITSLDNSLKLPSKADSVVIESKTGLYQMAYKDSSLTLATNIRLNNVILSKVDTSTNGSGVVTANLADKKLYISVDDINSTEYSAKCSSSCMINVSGGGINTSSVFALKGIAGDSIKIGSVKNVGSLEMSAAGGIRPSVRFAGEVNVGSVSAFEVACIDFDANVTANTISLEKVGTVDLLKASGEPASKLSPFAKFVDIKIADNTSVTFKTTEKLTTDASGLVTKYDPNISVTGSIIVSSGSPSNGIVFELYDAKTSNRLVYNNTTTRLTYLPVVKADKAVCDGISVSMTKDGANYSSISVAGSTVDGENYCITKQKGYVGILHGDVYVELYAGSGDVMNCIGGYPSIQDAIAEINTIKIKQDYVIKVAMKGKSSQSLSAMPVTGNKYSAVTMPNSSYINSLVIDGSTDGGYSSKLFYTGNITLTSKTVFRNIDFVQCGTGVVGADASDLWSDSIAQNAGTGMAPMVLSAGSNALTFDGVVRFNTPVDMKGSANSSLYYDDAAVKTIVPVVNPGSASYEYLLDGYRGMNLAGSISGFGDISIDEDTYIYNYSNASQKKTASSTVLTAGSISCTNLHMRGDASKLFSDGKVSATNLYVESYGDRIRSGKDFTITNMYNPKGYPVYLDTTVKDASISSTTPYLVISGIVENGAKDNIVVAVYEKDDFSTRYDLLAEGHSHVVISAKNAECREIVIDNSVEGDGSCTGGRYKYYINGGDTSLSYMLSKEGNNIVAKKASDITVVVCKDTASSQNGEPEESDVIDYYATIKEASAAIDRWNDSSASYVYVIISDNCEVDEHGKYIIHSGNKDYASFTMPTKLSSLTIVGHDSDRKYIIAYNSNITLKCNTTFNNIALAPVALASEKVGTVTVNNCLKGAGYNIAAGNYSLTMNDCVNARDAAGSELVGQVMSGIADSYNMQIKGITASSNGNTITLNSPGLIINGSISKPTNIVVNESAIVTGLKTKDGGVSGISNLEVAGSLTVHSELNISGKLTSPLLEGDGTVFVDDVVTITDISGTSSTNRITLVYSRNSSNKSNLTINGNVQNAAICMRIAEDKSMTSYMIEPDPQGKLKVADEAFKLFTYNNVCSVGRNQDMEIYLGYPATDDVRISDQVVKYSNWMYYNDGNANDTYVELKTTSIDGEVDILKYVDFNSAVAQINSLKNPSNSYEICLPATHIGTDFDVDVTDTSAVSALKMPSTNMYTALKVFGGDIVPNPALPAGYEASSRLAINNTAITVYGDVTFENVAFVASKAYSISVGKNSDNTMKLTLCNFIDRISNNNEAGYLAEIKGNSCKPDIVLENCRTKDADGLVKFCMSKGISSVNNVTLYDTRLMTSGNTSIDGVVIFRNTPGGNDGNISGWYALGTTVIGSFAYGDEVAEYKNETDGIYKTNFIATPVNANNTPRFTVKGVTSKSMIFVPLPADGSEVEYSLSEYANKKFVSAKYDSADHYVPAFFAKPHVAGVMPVYDTEDSVKKDYAPVKDTNGYISALNIGQMQVRIVDDMGSETYAENYAQAVKIIDNIGDVNANYTLYLRTDAGTVNPDIREDFAYAFYTTEASGASKLGAMSTPSKAASITIKVDELGSVSKGRNAAIVVTGSPAIKIDTTLEGISIYTSGQNNVLDGLTITNGKTLTLDNTHTCSYTDKSLGDTSFIVKSINNANANIVIDGGTKLVTTGGNLTVGTIHVCSDSYIETNGGAINIANLVLEGYLRVDTNNYIAGNMSAGAVVLGNISGYADNILDICSYTNANVNSANQTFNTAINGSISDDVLVRVYPAVYGTDKNYHNLNMSDIRERNVGISEKPAAYKKFITAPKADVDNISIQLVDAVLNKTSFIRLFKYEKGIYITDCDLELKLVDEDGYEAYFFGWDQVVKEIDTIGNVNANYTISLLGDHNVGDDNGIYNPITTFTMPSKANRVTVSSESVSGYGAIITTATNISLKNKEFVFDNVPIVSVKKAGTTYEVVGTTFTVGNNALYFNSLPVNYRDEDGMYHFAGKYTITGSVNGQISILDTNGSDTISKISGVGTINIDTGSDNFRTYTISDGISNVKNIILGENVQLRTNNADYSVQNMILGHNSSVTAKNVTVSNLLTVEGRGYIYAGIKDKGTGKVNIKDILLDYSMESMDAGLDIKAKQDASGSSLISITGLVSVKDDTAECNDYMGDIHVTLYYADSFYNNGRGLAVSLTDNMKLLSAAKVPSGFFSVDIMSDVGQITKSGNDIYYNYRSSDRCEVVMESPDHAYSISTFEDAIKEIDKNYQPGIYKVILQRDVSIGNEKNNGSYSALPVSAKSDGVIICSEPGNIYDLYYSGNITLKSPLAFNDINLRPKKAGGVDSITNFSVGKYLLSFGGGVSIQDEDGNSLLGNITGSANSQVEFLENDIELNNTAGISYVLILSSDVVVNGNINAGIVALIGNDPTITVYGNTTISALNTISGYGHGAMFIKGTANSTITLNGYKQEDNKTYSMFGDPQIYIILKEKQPYGSVLLIDKATKKCNDLINLYDVDGNHLNTYIIGNNVYVGSY